MKDKEFTAPTLKEVEKSLEKKGEKIRVTILVPGMELPYIFEVGEGDTENLTDKAFVIKNGEYHIIKYEKL